MSFDKQQIPSVGQLVSCMQATRHKYQSFDAVIQVSGTQPAPSKAQRQDVYQYLVVWRTDGQRHYYKIEGLNYDPKGHASKVSKTFLFTPQQSKRLVIHEDRQPRGYIAKGWPWKWKDPLNYGFTPYEALWDFFCEEINLDASTVDIDKASGNYVLSHKIGSAHKGPLVRLYIDPNKEYIPVKRQLIKMPDDRLVIDCECGSIRKEPNGLWIPIKYSTVNYEGFRIDSEVEKITVNKKMPDELFDLSFPEGTIIRDRTKE